MFIKDSSYMNNRYFIKGKPSLRLQISNFFSRRSRMNFVEMSRESELETEQGRYKAVDTIGEGAYDNARLFATEDNIHKAVVLKPKLQKNGQEYPDFEQAKVKFDFFNTLYQDTPFANQTKLFVLGNKTYRLALPFLPGIPYNEYCENLLSIMTNNEEEKPSIQYKILKSLVAVTDSVIDCHNKGKVVIDLKETNIIYDESHIDNSDEEIKLDEDNEQNHLIGKAYLIDGGLSSNLNDKISEVFRVTKPSKQRNAFPNIAPECWFKRKAQPKTATFAMDKYAIGRIFEVMHTKFELMDRKFENLINNCLNDNPYERLNLEQIRSELLNVVNAYKAQLNNQDEFITQNIFSPKNGLITPIRESEDLTSESKSSYVF